MLDKSIKNNSSNVKIDKRPKDPKKNPYGKDKPYINNIRVDDTGMWDPNNRNQPIMVMGNSMSTEGYGNMPLYVQPNGGNRGFVVPPNVGTINFGPNVSHFVETPMAQEGISILRRQQIPLGIIPKYSLPEDKFIQGWADNMDWLGEKYKDTGISFGKGSLTGNVGNYVPLRTAEPTRLINPYVGADYEFNNGTSLGVNLSPDYKGISISRSFQEGGDYNMQRALELGYEPDETGHWPSADDQTGMWLKSKQHPSAWMEYLYGYALNPEVQRQFRHPVINPEGYFGNNQLQYLPKEAYGGDPSLPNITGHYKFGGKYSPTETHMATGGWLEEYQPGGQTLKKLLNKGIESLAKTTKYTTPIKEYAKDVAYASKQAGRPKLPTYKVAARWQPDVVPESLKQAGKTLSKEQQGLTGSWYTYKPADQLGFYQRTRPGSGNVNMIKLSEREISNLEKSMPGYAKGMSGKDPVATSTDYLKGELVVPYKLRSKAKQIRFDVNPHEYIPSSKGIDPSTAFAESATGDFTNKIINSQYPNIMGIPRKYFPFEEGGWLDNRQNGGRLQSAPANVVRDFEGGSYYDPVTDTIYLNSIRGDFDLPHELYHRQQYIEGRLRIPEADPYGEARVKPSMLEEQSLVDYPYFNRREVDRDILTQDFFHGTTSGIRNPSFNMIPYDMVYDKAINPAMYHEPWTAEGEAELTGTLEGEQELIKRGIGPNYNIDDYYRRGGFLPKAQKGKISNSTLRNPEQLPVIPKPKGTQPVNNFRMDYGDLRKPVKEVASTTRVANNFNLPKKSDIIDPKVTAERRRKEQEANRAAIAAYVQPKKMAVEKIGSAEYIDRRGYPVSVPETYIDSVDVPNIVSYNELANPELSEVPEREIMKTDAELAQRQSKTSKAYDVFWHPFTAGKYIVNNQRIPDNLSQGETSDSDIMTFFNPIHGAAFTLESLYNLGKAAFDPNTYKALGTIAQSGVAPGTVNPNQFIEAVGNLSGPALDALFARMGYKGGKKMLKNMINVEQKAANKLQREAHLNKRIEERAKQQALLEAAQNLKGKKVSGTGMVGTKADAVIQTGKRYGPIKTMVLEGKYPAQSPTGNIKGDLFDLRNTGYTDVPGFNKQVQDLKRRAEFGVRPLEYKLPSERNMREFTDDLINESRGIVTDFGVSADELRDLQLKRFSGKDAFKMIEPNKQGGQLKLKKRKGTSQNVQSSINDLMMRNELIFGPPGKRRFVPYKQDGGESDITGGWLDNYV